MAQLAHKDAALIMSDLQLEADKMAGHKGAAVGAVSIQNGKHYHGYNSPGRNGVGECHTHAEVMSIAAMAEDDVVVDTRGSEMITTRAPCLYCAAHIIDAGVSVVYTPPLREGSKWYESQVSAQYAMKAVGIEIVTIKAWGVKG